jgi:AraC-like DNA-binding protein
MAGVAALISARLTGLIASSPVVGHAINLLGLGAFPLAVLYIRRATGRAAPWEPALAAPAVAYLSLVAGLAVRGADTVVPFAWLLPVVLGFTALGLVTLRSAGRRPMAALVPAEWVAGFLALVNLAQIARMDLGHLPAVRAVVPLVLVAGFALLAARVSWRSLQTSEAPATRPTSIVQAGAPEPVDAGPRYERSALDDTTAHDVLARINRAFDEDRVFARPDLTLGQLAAAIGATPHQVSEALNRVAGVSFRDLLNRRRVDDVKAQLRDPANDRYTVEGIGATAGFRSRSALYAAFHRVEGTTPTAYRAAAREDARGRT